MWVALALLAAYRMFQQLDGMQFLDLDVYQRAGVDVLARTSPYRERSALPFTYPPFAAVLAAPLAWMSPELAGVAMSLVSALALMLTIVVLRTRLGLCASSLWWVIPGCFLLAPVWRTFHFGQVNLVLMAMVILDAFLVPQRWRGLLTGVAAGIKITPGIYALYYVATRQWRAATLSAVGFLATLALGAAVLPADTVKFWLVLVRDPSRVGGLAYPDNVSITGSLIRTFGDQASAATWPLGAVCIGTGVVVAHGLHRRGHPVPTLLAVALAGLVASPVTWSHHWVWAVPVVMWLLAGRRFLAATMIAAALTVTPLDLAERFPDAGLMTAVGWLYPAIAAAVVLMMLRWTRRPLPADPTAGTVGLARATRRADPF